MRIEQAYSMKNKRSVLLVEDDRDDQLFFMEALGYIENVILYGVANNGEEALQKLERSEILPDIIFTDIHMPVMDGIEYISELIKNPHTQNIPVIVLSTATDKVDTVLQIGARGFVKKLSDAKTLSEQLKALINFNFTTNTQIAYQTFGTENMDI